MNDVLVRAHELIGRPVVTLHGDRVGEVKDVVLGLGDAVLVGFTLRNPGFLGGPRPETVPWERVHAVGPDAVMIAERASLAGEDDVDAAGAREAVDVPVVTEGGERVGRVTDVVLATGLPCQVVGFEVEAAPSMPSAGEHLLMPMQAVTSASEQAVVVPAGGQHFVQDDLAGFGAAVERFRSELEDRS